MKFTVYFRNFLYFLEQLCLTPECISLAADTYNAMDMKVDPCEVFTIF